MFEFAALSGYIGAVAFGLFSALLLAADRGHVIGRFLIGACFISTLWFALCGAYYAGHDIGLQIAGLRILELIRDLAWFAFLGAVLLHAHDEAFARKIWLLLGIAGLVLLTAVTFSVLPTLVDGSQLSLPYLTKATTLCYLLIAILGLTLIEQL
ncbi:MAG: hypothetical protein E2O35_03760, partial [Proteobacteria bacterium]